LYQISVLTAATSAAFVASLTDNVSRSLLICVTCYVVIPDLLQTNPITEMMAP